MNGGRTGPVEGWLAVCFIGAAAEPRTHKGDNAGAVAQAVEKRVRDPDRRHGIGHEYRGGLVATGTGGIAPALRRNPGIDEDEIEFEAVKAAAQRGDLRVVVDIEMFSTNFAAGLLRQFLQAALAGRVAHRPYHVPAAAFEFRREPEPQPARRPLDQRPPALRH